MHAHLLQVCIGALVVHLWHSIHISSVVACNESNNSSPRISQENIDNRFTLTYCHRLGLITLCTLVYIIH